MAVFDEVVDALVDGLERGNNGNLENDPNILERDTLVLVVLGAYNDSDSRSRGRGAA